MKTKFYSILIALVSSQLVIRHAEIPVVDARGPHLRLSTLLQKDLNNREGGYTQFCRFSEKEADALKHNSNRDCSYIATTTGYTSNFSTPRFVVIRKKARPRNSKT